MLTVHRVTDSQGRESVGISFSQEDVYLTAEGQPMPGVALQPASAKEVAYLILLLAHRLENGREIGIVAL
jgi:hypothetical protein